MTPLHKACIFGHVAVVKKLLETGAKLNDADGNGDTPLHYASRCGFPAIVKCLLEANALLPKNSAGLGPKECAANPAIAQLFP